MDDPSGLQELVAWFIDHLVLGILVLTRLSLLLMAMPAVAAGVPKRVRAFLAFLITLLLIPPIAENGAAATMPAIDNLVDLTIAIAREAMIGMLIGVVIQLIVAGMQLGGEAISGTGGMQLGDAIDPSTGGRMPTTASLVGILVTSFMLVIGGHRIVMLLLLDSFESLPAGDVTMSQSMLDAIVEQLTAGMAAGIRLAAPVLAALLLSNFVTGLISRTMPQINVLAIGLPLNALAMLTVLALTIGAAGIIFEAELTAATARLSGLW